MQKKEADHIEIELIGTEKKIKRASWPWWKSFSFKWETWEKRCTSKSIKKYNRK